MQYQHGGDIYTQEIHMDYSANLNPLGLPEGACILYTYRCVQRVPGQPLREAAGSPGPAP